jgi:small multidrug resistance pump
LFRSRFNYLFFDNLYILYFELRSFAGDPTRSAILKLFFAAGQTYARPSRLIATYAIGSVHQILISYANSTPYKLRNFLMHFPAWLYLTASIVFEVAGTTSMKLSDGFSRLVPSVLILVFYGISFYAFTLALKKMDLSVAYAVWAGSGTALVAIIGMIWFNDTVTALKLVCLGLVIIGVTGLNYA